MFVYHYRLMDRYNRRMVSLAVLGDDRIRWRPDCYRHEACGCKLEFRFPVFKLLDYMDRTDKLEHSDNPFAVLVLAHLKALETRGDPHHRYAQKLQLVRALYAEGAKPDQVRILFRFIDGIMDLSRELEQQFMTEVHQFEEKNQMPYVSPAERLAIEQGIEQGIEKGLEQGLDQGREQGLQEGIKCVLELRFGAIEADLRIFDG